MIQAEINLFSSFALFLNCYHSRNSDTWIRKKLWHIPVQGTRKQGELRLQPHSLGAISWPPLNHQKITINISDKGATSPVLKMKISEGSSLHFWEH